MAVKQAGISQEHHLENKQGSVTVETLCRVAFHVYPNYQLIYLIPMSRGQISN
jgi:uncharacterized protein YqfB (UPF0267 family)